MFLRNHCCTLLDCIVTSKHLDPWDKEWKIWIRIKNTKVTTWAWNLIVGFIQAKWKLKTTANYYKAKKRCFRKGKLYLLKLTVQILKINDRSMKKLIKQQVTMNKLQFGYMPGWGTTDGTFILRQLQEK